MNGNDIFIETKWAVRIYLDEHNLNLVHIYLASLPDLEVLLEVNPSFQISNVWAQTTDFPNTKRKTAILPNRIVLIIR